MYGDHSERLLKSDDRIFATRIYKKTSFRPACLSTRIREASCVRARACILKSEEKERKLDASAREKVQFKSSPNAFSQLFSRVETMESPLPPAPSPCLARSLPLSVIRLAKYARNFSVPPCKTIRSRPQKSANGDRPQGDRGKREKAREKEGEST